MIKNPHNHPSYTETFDAPALIELRAMAARYVAKENGIAVSGRTIPNGTYSDFSCQVWQIFVDAIRLGIDISNGENPEIL